MESLAALEIITKDLKTCLESTERAVSQVVNSRRSPSIRSSPPRAHTTPPRSKTLRKILHHSHARFKKLILAQHQEIVALRKFFRSKKNSQLPPKTFSNAPTPSSSSLRSSPKAAITVKRGTTPTNYLVPTTPEEAAISSLPKPTIDAPKEASTNSETFTTPSSSANALKEERKQQREQSLRKRVIDLLKRHHVLSSRLTGKNTSEDSSTLVELRSITARLGDLGINVPLTGPRKLEQAQEEGLNSPNLESVEEKSSKTVGEESKHFEYLFAKIMSGPVKTKVDNSLSPPGRRRAKIGCSHANKSLAINQTVTPPRNTNSSPRNSTPGSRKRARITARDDIDLFTSPELATMKTPERNVFIPSMMCLSSPSSSYELNNETNVEEEYHEKFNKLTRHNKPDDTKQKQQETTNSTPPRLFVMTPPRHNMNKDSGTKGQKIGHAIHPSSMSSSSNYFSTEISNINVLKSNEMDNHQHHQQEHNSVEQLEDAMVGSPFPPMSPILEPVDRSGVFASDDIMSDLHVVKTLSMIGGSNKDSPKQQKLTRLLSSPPINGLLSSQQNHRRHQQLSQQQRAHARKTSRRASSSIPFVDARPRQRSNEPIGTTNGGIPWVRRIRSPKLNNKINLRNSIRLARKGTIDK
jgi:hypothetical protein